MLALFVGEADKGSVMLRYASVMLALFVGEPIEDP